MFLQLDVGGSQKFARLSNENGLSIIPHYTACLFSPASDEILRGHLSKSLFVVKTLGETTSAPHGNALKTCRVCHERWTHGYYLVTRGMVTFGCSTVQHWRVWGFYLHGRSNPVNSDQTHCSCNTEQKHIFSFYHYTTTQVISHWLWNTQIFVEHFRHNLWVGIHSPLFNNDSSMPITLLPIAEKSDGPLSSTEISLEEERQTGNKHKVFHSETGNNHLSGSLSSYCKTINLTHNRPVPYAPQRMFSCSDNESTYTEVFLQQITLWRPANHSGQSYFKLRFK